MAEIDYTKLQIAVIEDEGHTRRIILQILRRIGVQHLIEAADGKQGLDKVIDRQPDLVFCDIHMEPVDGIVFLRTLRKLSEPQGISMTPVIFLTADSATDTVLVAKELRVNGYLVKPVSVATVKARIDAVLGRG